MDIGHASSQAAPQKPAASPALRIYHGIPGSWRVFPNEVREPPASSQTRPSQLS